MIFWPHNNDLSKPPELEDLRYRKPDKDYWESHASDKKTARHNFWVIWKRKTGKEYPSKLPSLPEAKRHGIINRTTSSHRPKHQIEKDAQDRNLS